MDAQFVSGNPLMVDHTPGADVAAGDVVVTGDTTRIAHLDIPANTLGALAAGGGVYKVTADALIAADKNVFWVAATAKVSESAAAGANKPFGYTVEASGADGDLIEVIHNPAAPAA